MVEIRQTHGYQHPNIPLLQRTKPPLAPMSKTGSLPSAASAIPGKSTHPDGLGESLQAACQQIVAGRNASRRIAAMVRRFALSEAEFRLLWQLRQCEVPRNRLGTSHPSTNGPALDQTSLRAKLALSPAQISSLIQQLRAREWITREVDPVDRRRQLMQLTEQGRALMNKVLVHMKASLFQREPVLPSVPARGEGREKAA